MTRVALTATMKNPDLLRCTPESLTNALLTCSQAGLEPDGRLAHLIPYGNVVQVIFDYKGLVTLALRNGAESVYSDKVCEFDQFDAFVEDGIKKLNHKPNWKGNRGTATCYYAVCKRAGEVDWEVMSMEEVEAIRDRSRAKASGPWKTDFDEMAKKTVLRRMSKRWDLLPEIRDVINADDDTPPPFGTVTTTRPLFEPKALPTPEAEPAGEEPQADAPEPDAPVDEREPEAEAPPAGNGGGQNYLKAVRNLCKMAKIKETSLLGFWSETGSTDGSQSTLEEVAVSAPNVMRLTHDQWGDISGRILAVQKGGVK
jgi:recombination protein RecT